MSKQPRRKRWNGTRPRLEPAVQYATHGRALPSRAQLRRWARAALERYGAEVIVCPTIEIVEPESYERLDEAIDHLYGYDWLIFTSANAIEYFLRRLKTRGINIDARMTKNGMKDGQRNRVNRLGATAFFLAAKTTDFEVMKVLADDKQFFPRYNIGVTLRDEMLKRYPQLAQVFQPISEKLTNEELMKLNAQPPMTQSGPYRAGREYYLTAIRSSRPRRRRAFKRWSARWRPFGAAANRPRLSAARRTSADRKVPVRWTQMERSRCARRRLR